MSPTRQIKSFQRYRRYFHTSRTFSPLFLALAIALLTVSSVSATPTSSRFDVPDLLSQPRQTDTVELTPKQLRKLEKAEAKAREKELKKNSRQNLNIDQREELNRRIQAVEGLPVGQYVRVTSGSRGTPTERTPDSILYRAEFIQQLSDSLLYVLLPDSTLNSLDSLRQIKLLPDTLVASLVSDSLLLKFVPDSILHTARFPILAAVDTSFLGSADRLPDTDTLVDPDLLAGKRRLRLQQDTISAGRHSLLSVVAPGFGQIYNRQTWKLPILYGGLGGFITGGVLFGKQHSKYTKEYDRTVNLRMPAEVQSRARDKMRRAGSGKTLMYGMAGATYLYFVADAVFNYRGPVDPIRKATTLAAVFPGMGFVYTKTYWRLPIYYGGFIALATVIDYNNRYYQRYKKAYDALTDGNPSTTDEFNKRYSPDLIARVRKSYRRDRDLAIILTAGVYLLSVIDTYVIASLKNWNVDQDLSIVKVAPTIIDTRLSERRTNTSVPSNAFGMGVQVRF